MNMPYRCLHCHSPNLAVRADSVDCECGLSYERRHAITDFLGKNIDVEVRAELTGLARENGIDTNDLDAVKWMLVEHVETLAECLALSEDDPVDYYRQTLGTFEEALGELPTDLTGWRVLEVGAERSMPMLRTCS